MIKRKKLFKIRYISGIICIFLVFEKITSQENNLKSLSGIVKNTYNELLPDVTIKIKNKDKSNKTDFRGLYSIVAVKGDSVIFSHPGYTNSRICLPDTIKCTFCSYDIVMIPDTIVIEAVSLFPWKTYNEFKQAFLSYVPPRNREIENAVHNIALVQTYALLYNEPDPERNFNDVMKLQVDRAANYGMVPSISLLNPFAWAKFIQAISNGSLFNSRDMPEPPR